MHEVHQVQKVVAESIALAKSQDLTKVRKATLIVGELLGFDEGCIRLYWQEMTTGTVLEGSELTVQFAPAKFLCPQCGQTYAKRKSDLECPQCHIFGSLTPSGKEFFIQDLS